MPTYRKYHHSDAAAVTRLIQQFFSEDKELKHIPPEYIPRTLTKLGEQGDGGNILVIEHEEKIIGYTLLVNYWSNSDGGNMLVIDELYIDKAYQGQGIGTDLANYLIDTRFNNSLGIQLEITPGNEIARKLYKKLGFKDYDNQMLIKMYN